MVKMLSGACAGYCVYCGENKTMALKKSSKLFIQNWSIFRKTAFILFFLQWITSFLVKWLPTIKLRIFSFNYEINNFQQTRRNVW